jgi:signal recognition particle GTPase
MVNALIGAQESKLGEKPAGLKVFVLSGMGGSGKTQIALKFAKEYQTK